MFNRNVMMIGTLAGFLMVAILLGIVSMTINPVLAQTPATSGTQTTVPRTPTVQATTHTTTTAKAHTTAEETATVTTETEATNAPTSKPTATPTAQAKATTESTNASPSRSSATNSGYVRQITVIGFGEASSPPDIAQVQIGVETESETAQDALKQNTVKSTDVISKLKELGIAEKDVQTSNFSIYPTYDEKGHTVAGYRVSNTVLVKIHDLSTTGTLLDQVVKVGANSIYGISFSVKDPSEVMTKAREKAMDDAKEKAEQLAGKAGAKVGQVLMITENIGSMPQPMPMMQRAEVSSMGSAVPVQPGEQAYSTQIQVTFELE